MKPKKSIFTYLLLVAAVVILVNILAAKLFFRLDFTQDNAYTLSKATKDILKSLNEPLTVTAYFSEDLPPEIAKVRRDFKDLLIEYSTFAKSNLRYEFVNPNSDEQTENKALHSGVQPIILDVREKDQIKQQKAYMGAVLQIGDRKEIVPFIHSGSSMEYVLSSSIKKISITDKPTIAYLQGHGEPTLNAIPQVYAALSILYNISTVDLKDSAVDLTKFKTAVLLSPKDTISPQDFLKLDNFLNNGGRLFIGCDNVVGDFSTASGNVHTTGVENWLSQKGLTIEKSFVIDVSCAFVNLAQRQGAYQITTQVPFPYLPIIKTFENHAITKGLEQVILQFASPLTFKSDGETQFISLLKTSEKSGIRPAPLIFDVQKQWIQQDFPLKNIPVAGLLTKKLSNHKEWKIVVVSDGDFAINGTGQEMQQLQPDNINFIVNAIDWLSDDTGLMELRTATVTSRPIDEINDEKKILIKYFNFLFPILAMLGYGIFRMQYNRTLRIKRMDENFI